MDWMAGYVSDIEYVGGIHPEQGPEHLNLACVLNGFEPRSVDKEFTYFELGFGKGHTISTLAAAYPHGRFYANDFHPAHVNGAQQLADAAGLDNLTLLEESFEQLAAGAVALPQFDFITLHGVYSWVSPDNQRFIDAFLSRYLKPGGVVYVSYNCMTGWAQVLPLQRLLRDYAGMLPGRSDERLGAAAGFASRLAENKAGLFQVSPAIATHLDKLQGGSNINYLAHEYMNRHWQPLFFQDVAQRMAANKLDYAASAELPLAYPQLVMPPALLGMLKEVPDPVLRESVKDYCLATSFRKDVYVRGARPLPQREQIAWLHGVMVSLNVPRAAVGSTVKLFNHEVSLKESLPEPVLDRLGQGDASVLELAKIASEHGKNLALLLQLLVLLGNAGTLMLYRPSAQRAEAAAARRFNRLVAQRALADDACPAFASPLLGRGFNEDALGRALYSVVAGAEHPVAADEAAAQLYALLKAHGKLPAGEEESARTDLVRTVAAILPEKLAKWTRLQAI